MDDGGGWETGMVRGKEDEVKTVKALGFGWQYEASSSPLSFSSYSFSSSGASLI